MVACTHEETVTQANGQWSHPYAVGQGRELCQASSSLTAEQVPTACPWKVWPVPLKPPHWLLGKCKPLSLAFKALNQLIPINPYTYLPLTPNQYLNVHLSRRSQSRHQKHSHPLALCNS